MELTELVLAECVGETCAQELQCVHLVGRGRWAWRVCSQPLGRRLPSAPTLTLDPTALGAGLCRQEFPGSLHTGPLTVVFSARRSFVTFHVSALSELAHLRA